MVKTKHNWNKYGNRFSQATGKIGSSYSFHNPQKYLELQTIAMLLHVTVVHRSQTEKKYYEVGISFGYYGVSAVHENPWNFLGVEIRIPYLESSWKWVEFLGYTLIVWSSTKY